MKHGLYPTSALTDAELIEVRALATACEVYDQIDLRLGWEGMQARAGEYVGDFLFYRAGRLVGYMGLEGLGFARPEASCIVHPAERRRGVGAALAAAALAECRANGAERLALFCNRRSAAARPFLAALGAEYHVSEHKMRLVQHAPGVRNDPRLVFRRADSADAPALADILAEGFSILSDHLRAKIASDMLRGSYRYYIAHVGPAPVGTISAQLAPDRAFIYGFVVCPEHRGRGYGRQMLDRAIADIAAERPRQIFLEVEADNPVALALYHSAGFAIIETYDYYQLRLAPRDVAEVLGEGATNDTTD